MASYAAIILSATKKRNSLYQLVDFYTSFYLRFIEHADPADQYNWRNAVDTPSYRAWSGYAFEQVALYHVQQIKNALGISGIISHTYSWKSRTSDQGAQIDLLIDRRDQVINLCEIKFSTDTFTITKAYAEQLRHKIRVFRTETGTKKAVYLSMITPYGLQQNTCATDWVQHDLDMNVLFE